MKEKTLGVETRQDSQEFFLFIIDKVLFIVGHSISAIALSKASNEPTSPTYE